jgi:putative ATP-binding cassette transporter
MFTTAYGMLANAFPLLIASPRYIMGLITLGALVQTAQAFQLVSSALAWPVDNLAKLAEWRASAGRVLSLHAILGAAEAGMAAPGVPRLEVEVGETPTLVLDHVAIDGPATTRASARGAFPMAPISASIAAGEHVIVSGERALVGLLPKVIARLWPWGSGRVVLPSDGPVFVMSEDPYLPVGALRGAVCYPQLPDQCDVVAISAALRRVGLGHLLVRQSERADWQQTLSHAERQLIGFARLLIQRPRWIVLDRAMSALDEEERTEMNLVLAEELSGATVISVNSMPHGSRPGRRELVLTRERRRVGVRQEQTRLDQPIDEVRS